MLVQVDAAGAAGGLGTDAERHHVEGDLGPVHLHPGAEGGAQGEEGVRVQLSEVGVPTAIWGNEGEEGRNDERGGKTK